MSKWKRWANEKKVSKWKRWSEWWVNEKDGANGDRYIDISMIFFTFFFQKICFNIFPWKKMERMVSEWKKDGANGERMKKDGANGDKYIDISVISFTYGANYNRYINLSTLFTLSNYQHINTWSIHNINQSTLSNFPQYYLFWWSYRPLVLFNNIWF